MFIKLFKLSMQPYMEGETDTGAGSTTEPTGTTETQSTEPTTTQQTETQQTEPQNIRVKFNHEEREIPYEEAVTHIQRGMNYDKGIERARQEATDTVYANLGYEWNGKPITTEAQYKEAVREQEIRKQLETRDLPPEVIEELVENRKDREKRKAKDEELAKSEAKGKEQLAFLEYFKQVNKRSYDGEKDILPAQFWQEVDSGRPLKDAYIEHRNSTLEAKNAELEAKLKAIETNQSNAASSPGSVTGNGSPGVDHISFETFNANKHDQSWVNKNFTKINESRKTW